MVHYCYCCCCFLSTGLASQGLPAGISIQDRLVTISDELRIALRECVSSDRVQDGSRPAAINILATHGYLDNAGSFDLLAPFLVSRDPRIRVVSMDLLGHGLSDHSKGPYQYLDQIEVMNDVLDALGWQTCVLMGHSYGGNNSLMYAAACPERVLGLIVRTKTVSILVASNPSQPHPPNRL